MQEDKEVMVVSYLDIYAIINKQYDVSQVAEVAFSGSNDELMGLGSLPENLINDCLEELGMDMGRAIETRVGLHRPRILAIGSENESTPVIYGKNFHGFLKKKVNKWQ